MRIFAIALASYAAVSVSSARADTVHDALEAYAQYQTDVSVLLDLEVDNAQTINAALARLSRHEPARVSRGFIAYGALTAAQSPSFAAGVQRRARAGGRAQFLELLRGDVSYARREAAGSPQAIQLILGAARADSRRASVAGDRYDRMARTVSADWPRSSHDGAVTLTSARLTPEMRERLRVGALEAQPLNNADAFGGGGFWDALAGRDVSGSRIRGAQEARGYANVTDRMLTLGALVVVGAGRGERTHMSELLDEPITEQCLTMQRLQLRQCLSVSVDASERTYCLGRHGLSGPGSCFSAMTR